MKKFQEFLEENKKGAPKRVPKKRGGGSYEKFRKGTKDATYKETFAVVKKMASKLNLKDVRDASSTDVGWADAKANDLTTDNMVSAVESIGGTNIKFYDGRDGVVSYSRVFFELGETAYYIDARRFDSGNAHLDFQKYYKGA